MINSIDIDNNNFTVYVLNSAGCNEKICRFDPRQYNEISNVLTDDSFDKRIIDINGKLVMTYTGATNKASVTADFLEWYNKFSHSLTVNELILFPRDYSKRDKSRFLAKQCVQLRNSEEHKLGNVPRELFYKHINEVADTIEQKDTRNMVYNFLENVMKHSKHKIHKRWAAQVYNTMVEEYFDKHNALKEATDNGILNNELTPIDYSRMIKEIYFEAKANGVTLNIKNIMDNNKIDYSNGYVSERKLFLSMADAYQTGLLNMKKDLAAIENNKGFFTPLTIDRD